MTRIGWLLLVILAVVVVAVAVALGKNPQRTVRSGPRWKRWLMGTGLSVLAALGCNPSAADTPEPKAPGPGATEQDKPVGWQAIDSGWAYARPLAESGESTSNQRKVANEKLDQAVRAARALVKDGQLTKAEADLLATEAETLKARIRRNPPSDHQVKCYKRAFLPKARQSMDRLEKRMPLVEQAIESGKIHPRAMGKILVQVETDLEVLSSEKELSRLEGAERTKAEQAAKGMRAKVDTLRKMMTRP